MRLSIVMLLLLVISARCALADDGVTLVQNGKPAAVLVVAADAHADEKLAADEIAQHIKAMSGAELPRVESAKEAGKRLAVLIGAPAMTAAMRKAVEARGDDPAGFALFVDGKTVRIAGLSAEGTLFGAYELLEQLGCRWFMPGRLGRVIPEKKTLRLPQQTTAQSPSFAGRHLQTVSRGRPWYRRQRLGGPFFPSAHGIPVRGISVQKNPAFFALVNGKRTRRQHCVSNPELVRLTIEATKNYFRKRPDRPWIGIGPNDGGGFCQCDDCRALDGGDHDPFADEISVTDRYVWFFNQILEGIADEFPKKKVCFYSYHTYMRPPVRWKPSPRIVPAFAPITLCRIHGMSNPICPDRSYYSQLIEGWSKLIPTIYERGYFFNLADPGFPFSKVHAMRDEIPKCKKLGVTGWRVETIPHWGSMTPTIYVAPRLWWNVDADVDALLADFYDKFFGPAAGPMGHYCELLDAAFRDGDFHTGCSYGLPHFFPPARIKKMNALLKQAEQQVPEGSIYAERVAVWRLMFDYMDNFLQMLQHRNDFDFAAAQKNLDRVKALQKKAVSYDPPLIWPRVGASYLRRFWSPCTEQGHERTSGKNQFVAGCPNTWKFLIDPTDLGEDIGYWRPDVTGGNWQSIKTKTHSWSDQGLHYYKGDAWYRCSVDVPAKFKGRKIMLWFGGVDELAKVWVNGKLIGTSPGRSFVPFEMDATEAVRFGKPNVIAVRITNRHLNEIGTGGITAPVMFYAPGEQ